MSPEHYPKSVYQATYFCKTCMRNTLHAVYDGRLGPCKEHSPKEKPPKPESKQNELFKE